jgi:3-phenylpropionate/cinnamic acid dioxygenase small subunit
MAQSEFESMIVCARKDAIRELLYRYCFAMDQLCFDALGALFAEDGEWIAPYGRAVGPDAIATLMARNVPATPRRMHFTMNSVIEVSGDAATAQSNYLVMLDGDTGLTPSVCGIYADALLWTAAGWRFRRRELVHHIRGDMALTIKV